MSRSNPRQIEGFDWLIDTEAAMRERFPTLRQVKSERPGCEADRTRQQLYREENRQSVARAAAAARRARRQEEDADMFIAHMRRRKGLEFVAQVKDRQTRRETA